MLKQTKSPFLFLVLIISSTFLFTACENEREEDQIILLQQYITKNQGDVPVLESGLFYVLVDTTQAENPISPLAGDSLFMSIDGKLADNATTFMSNDHLEPFVHIYKEHPAIEGWEEGLALMHEGDSAVIGIPPALAYGDKREGIIPPYSSLIFKLRLIKIVRN